MKIKRTLALVLALVMILGMLPTVALAEETVAAEPACAATGEHLYTGEYIWNASKKAYEVACIYGCGDTKVTDYVDALTAVAQVGDEKFETLDEALAAAQEGDTVTLLADATPALTSQRAITKAAVIDLGGYTLTLMEDDLYFGTTTFKNGTIVVDPSVKPRTAVFWMFANQTLTFDNVKLVATGVTGTYLIGLDGNNADLNLLNGSEIFIENTAALDLDVICVNESSGNDIVIDNSKVNVTNLDGRVFFRGNYTVSGNSDIDLEGITKAGFRIEAGQTLTIADTSTVDIVGEPRDGGIHLTDVTSVYTVAETATVNATVNKPGPVEVRTYEELVAALEKDNANVIMMNDITATATQATSYGKAGIVLNAGDVLDGNGKTLTINGAGGTWDCTVGMLGGELKNLTVSGGFRGVFMPGANGDVVIDKCTIENVVYTFNSDAGSTDYTVTIKNTELNGWTSYSAVHKSVEFEDCSFGEGSGYAFCRPYQATTFTGCAFAEGYEIDTAQVADNKLAFSDCTYAGEALSAENGGKLFNDSGIVLVDGVSVDYNKVYVAQVGEEKFESLDEALAAVTAGSELTLYTDATITAPIKATADLTINGNGNTLTYTGTDRAITVESGADADLTVKDLTVVAEKAQRGINYNTNGALVLDKVTVSGATYAVNLPSSSDGAVVTITNSSLSGNIALNVWGEDAVINVTDTALVGVDKTDVEGYSTVKLNNNGTDAAEGTVITITGGSISAEDDSYAYSNSTATGVINVSDTIVTGPVGSAVAVINYGNTSYSFATLADAIEKAQDGETVKLLKDVSVSEIIVLDKAITLDGNGKTLTSTAGRAINVSGADGVTIKNLTINASGERAINVIQNATNVTVKNVVATAANYTVNVASSAANAVVTVENSDLTGLNVINVGAANAQITVTGGKITCNDQTDVENYSALALNKDATGASIVANNVEFEIKGDSSKAVNGATNGTITIDGSSDEVVEDVAYISYGNNYYGFSTLADAVAKAQDGETVVLMKNASGAGVVIDKDVTIDFAGYTYTFTSGVGSGSLTSNGFQILQGNTVTLKNGKLDVAEESKEEFYILVQNYADLTVTDMVLDGTNLDKWSTSDGDSYVLSNNSGNVVINGKTDIIANDEGELAYAFDAFSKAGYEAPTVTVNTTGTITGNVEVTGGDLNVEAATINGALVYTAGNVTKAETVTLAAPEGYEWVNGVLTAVNYVAQVGEKKYETLAEALAAEKEAGTTDLVITIIGTNDKTSADSFELLYGTVFDSVTIKQDNGGEPYYMATLYTGSRTNGGTFVFDGVNIIVTEQYMFEGNVKLANNSVVKSVAEANCFHYYSTTTVEPGSKLQGVIDEMRGGELIIDGGRTDGEYNSTPDAQDAIMSISWNGDSVTVKNGAYVKINAANEVGRLTVKSGASLNVYDSKLESYQWIANEGTINADIDSQITTQKITGAGTITVDATGFDGTAVKVIDADMSEFTGEIEIANASAGFEIREDGIYVVKIPAIKVTYPNGTVEYYEDILEAVPYTTNCPRLEGAVVTLQKDISGQGLRLMENDMVLDLNGYTYTITAGTGSQNTNTSGFQIRPEVTTKATIKNGTIKVAEGAPVVWMFNSYATDFVVEDVVVDCANMAYSYGESVFVHVSRPGDNTNFTGTTKIVNFDAAKAGSIINVGGTMTIEETVVFDGTVELDAGATLTAPAGLTVVTVDGYEVVYENGIYTTVEAVWNGETIASVKDFIAFAKASQSGESFSGKTIKLTADIDFEGANYLEIAEDGTVVTDYRIPKFSGTFDGQGYTIKNFNYVVKNCGKHNIMMFSQDNMWAYIKNLNIENVNVNIADISGQTRITALTNRVNAGGMTSAAIENVHVKNFKIVCGNTTSNDLRIGGLAYFVQGSQLIAKDCSIEGFEVDVNEARLVGGAVAVVKSKCDFENVDVKAVFDIDKLGTSGVIGGFVGQTQDQGTGTTFTDCDVEVEMNLDSAESLIGGFIGSIGSVSQFYNCTTKGSIAVETGNGVSTSIGGFTGDLGWNGMFAPDVQHEFNNCVADVDITAVNANVGGFIGHSTVTGYPKRFMPAYFNGCVAKGDVKTESGVAGGFVGTGDRGIFNGCSASGNATGRIAGGFWGEIYPKAEAESTGGWSYQNKVVTHTDPNSKSIVLEGLTVTGTATGTEYEADLIGFMKDIYVNDDDTLGYATPVVMTGNNTSEYNRYHYPVYVAQVGDEKFESLEEAIANGSEITLLADITIEAPIKVTADLTIDGNGYTLTYTGTDRAITVESGVSADLTVKNLTVVAAKAQRGINYNTTGALTLTDVTVTAGTYAVNLPGSSDGAQVAITNSDLTACIALNVWGENAVINVTDTDLTSVDNSAAEGYVAVMLNNDKVTSAEGTVLTITGGSITATDENGEPATAYTNATATGIINISETTVINGVAVEYVAVVNYGENSYYCKSLADALKVAANGNIYLLADTDEAVQLPVGIVINRNGYTASGLTAPEGLAIAATADTYKAANLPNANVQNLGEILVEGDHYIYGLVTDQKLTSSSDPFNLQVAMTFAAKDTLEQAQANAFGGYTTDFFINISGLTNGSFVGNGCYLAGFYPWDNKSEGDGLWVVIPLDGFTVEDGVTYPVISSAGYDFKYTDIVSSVGEFTCGIYLTPEVLAANPDIEVDLTLGLSENLTAAKNGQYITVDNYVYDEAALNVPYTAQIGTAKYVSLAEALTVSNAVELIANTDEAVELTDGMVITRNGFTASALTAAKGYKVVETEETYTVEEKEPTILNAGLNAIEVSMDSSLLLWLKFNLPEELVNDDDAYAIVTADRKGGLKETIIPMTEIRAKGTDARGRYVIEQGMAAPEMGRDVTVSFVDGFGNYVNLFDYATAEVSTSVTRTIVDYAKLALEKGNDKQKEMNQALLTYGGYSQLYFNVDVEAPVYDILPQFGFEVPTLDDITADSISQEMTTDGAALVTPTSQQAFLDFAIYHRVYFTLNDGVAIEDLSFVLTKANRAGEYTEAAEAVYEAAKDRYYIQIDGIASPLLDYMYNVEITDAAGNIQNVTTSVAAYLKLGISKSTDANQVNMFKAMFNYNQVANSFFGI